MKQTLVIFIFFMSSFAFAQSVDPRANPNLSVNGLFTYTHSSKGNLPDGETQNGFEIQELEMRYDSNIDAYFRGVFTFAMEREEPETPGEDGEYHLHAEEAFVETLQLPAVTLRLGQYLVPWGRHGGIHQHAFHFIDAPLSQSAVYGDHVWTEAGVAALYLLPTPWFSELTVQAIEAENEHVFGSGTRGDIAGAYQWRNLFDLNPTSTFEWSVAAAHGTHQDKEKNHAYNTALTYKWRPTEHSKSTSLEITAEASSVENHFEEGGGNEGRITAGSLWVRYQAATRWWFQLRTEQQEVASYNDGDVLNKNSALVAFVPTEYSALRLQFDTIDDPMENEVEQRAILQLNYSIGAHPAHAY